MGVEAEGVVLNAVAITLAIGIRIAFLDRSDDKLTFCDYSVVESEGSEVGRVDDSGKPLIHVQLRPGHYDLVYFRSSQQQEAFHRRQSRQPTLGPDALSLFSLNGGHEPVKSADAPGSGQPRQRTPRTLRKGACPCP